MYITNCSCKQNRDTTHRNTEVKTDSSFFCTNLFHNAEKEIALESVMPAKELRKKNLR
jgi:hypothetical protein